MSHVHSGFRHDLQVYPSRAATYFKLAAASLVCAGISLAAWVMA